MSATTTVLVGGSGFIGAALARQLRASGSDVRVADVRPSTVLPDAWVRADVRDADAVARACATAETIYMLAVERGHEAPFDGEVESINVGGARSVAAAASRTGVRRIVFTSTVAVYRRASLVADESAECRPRGPYGRSKLAAEAILGEWASADPDRSLVIVRPTIVFGAGLRGRMRAFFQWIAQPQFAMIGTGLNRKSLAHVDNLAAFLAHVRAAGPGSHLFNYSDGPDLTMTELTTLIRTAVGLGPPARHLSREAALVRAALRALRPGGSTASEPSMRQVRGFCANTQFASSRVAGTGFRPRLALGDAVHHYARSDLRWAARPHSSGGAGVDTDDA